MAKDDGEKVVYGCLLIFVSLIFSGLSAIALYYAANWGLGLEVQNWGSLIGFYFLYAFLQGISKGLGNTIGKL